jgi:hypothetical protein
MVLGLDECFTVMSGCVSQFKSHGVDIDSSKKKEFQRRESGESVLRTFLGQAKPSQIQTEGETFNECALEVFQLFQPLVFLNSRPSLSLCSDFLLLASHLNV